MKSNQMIWSILLHFGSNMWGKKDSPVRHFKDPDDDSIYRDHMHLDKQVWTDVTNFLPSCGINTLIIDIGDGIILDSHPEIAIDGAWTKEEFKKELERLRGLGLEVIPKCNFSCGHNAWLKEYSYMVGTETFYKVCDDIVEEIIDIFDTPRFFHLGLEEEDYVSQKSYPIAVVRSPEVKLRDALRLFDVCLSRGVRPWIWADQPTIDAFGGDEVFKEKIPKSVLMSNWYYGLLRDKEDIFETNTAAKTYKKLSDWGYEQVPTCSNWSWHLNSKDTMRLCSRHLDENSIVGYMTAPWYFTIKNKYYALLDAAYSFGIAKEKYYGDK